MACEGYCIYLFHPSNDTCILYLLLSRHQDLCEPYENGIEWMDGSDITFNSLNRGRGCYLGLLFVTEPTNGIHSTSNLYVISDHKKGEGYGIWNDLER